MVHPALRISLPALLVLLACHAGVAVAEEETESKTRSIAELQLGGGALAGITGINPMVQAQARFALWRTIGLGLYAAGSPIGGGKGSITGVVPVCIRANLSAPFWRSFEPVISLGAGRYHYTVKTLYGNSSEGELGFHLACALLFPHHHRGFGIEGAMHISGSPRYSDEFEAFLTLTGTMLIR